MAAFNQQTGALVWKAGDFDESPASPMLIDVDGQPQLVVFAGDRVAGLDPDERPDALEPPHKTDWGLNISTPVWSPADHLLFVSSAYSTGSRAIELRQAGGKTTVAEKWFSNRMRVHIGTIIRLGDHAYASSGDFGPAFLSAVDLKTGKIAWQDRSFSRAQLALRRRQTDHPGRGRHAGPRDGLAAGAEGPFARRRCSRTSPGRRRRSPARRCMSAIARTSPHSISARSTQDHEKHERLERHEKG